MFKEWQMVRYNVPLLTAPFKWTFSLKKKQVFFIPKNSARSLRSATHVQWHGRCASLAKTGRQNFGTNSWQLPNV